MVQTLATGNGLAGDTPATRRSMFIICPGSDFGYEYQYPTPVSVYIPAPYPPALSFSGYPRIWCVVYCICGKAYCESHNNSSRNFYVVNANGHGEANYSCCCCHSHSFIKIPSAKSSLSHVHKPDFTHIRSPNQVHNILHSGSNWA